MARLTSQERILVIVEKLAGKPAEGAGNKALALDLQTTEATVCRDMKLLESYGWVERSGADNGWRLSEKFGGFAGQIMKGFQVAKLRLAEAEARYASAMQ